ncbi:E3 ubiquitin-protein ligase RDUF1-like protein, partial [Drosera capensis]
MEDVGLGGRREEGGGRNEQPPASKVAIEAMSRVEIEGFHMETESYFAISKETFEVGVEARETPACGEDSCLSMRIGKSKDDGASPVQYSQPHSRHP